MAMLCVGHGAEYSYFLLITFVQVVAYGDSTVNC